MIDACQVCNTFAKSPFQISIGLNMKSPFLPVTFLKSENYVQGKNSEKG
ncbi:hypothetical protein CLW00_11023 [Mongoliibacter ruber]|uniref:Uncharacterized protein n=1 Tax=Mongoliibacter ruber TaxID=1750599 RepID=A0A2T0WGR7_9BACT|nr:hypothetical protein CLW00_11023 [Mongoliibacter ruber]